MFKFSGRSFIGKSRAIGICCDHQQIAGRRGYPFIQIWGGHPLRIALSPDTDSGKSKRQVLSTDDMNDIRLSLSLSDHETLKLGSHIRSAALSKLAVQKNLKQALNEMNHQLDDLFEVTNIDFVRIEKGEIVEKTRDGVLCAALLMS